MIIFRTLSCKLHYKLLLFSNLLKQLLLKFYHLLITEPSISKLLKDCQKHVQWKADIDEVSVLLGFNSSDKQSNKKTKERLVWE